MGLAHDKESKDRSRGKFIKLAKEPEPLIEFFRTSKWEIDINSIESMDGTSIS